MINADEPKSGSGPSLPRLFLLYLRLASLTFGGGNPTMAAMYTEMVTSRKWLSAERYAVSYALARITPGTNMLAFCAGTAWELLGWCGALAGVLAASVPAAIVVMLLTEGYDAVRANAPAMAAISGTLAAAVGMMAASAWDLLKPHMNRQRWLHAAIISGAALVLSLGFQLSPVLVLALAAAAGLVWRIPE
jgi:chromate transporter